ncbi:putative carboxypeptidase [Venturia inaequalis]|nr:putative carboxypeptidase [Venturia inaequalis]
MDLDKTLAKQVQDPFSVSATPLPSTAFVAAMITQVTMGLDSCSVKPLGLGNRGNGRDGKCLDGRSGIEVASAARYRKPGGERDEVGRLEAGLRRAMIRLSQKQNSDPVVLQEKWIPR